MGKRGKQNWSREKLPIGAVRVRQHSKRSRVRMIKIADPAAPKGWRWMHYARWWWLQHRGPIPAGMRVVHRDGDTLNDDPKNYILATAGDVAYLAREWDATLDERNRRAVAKALAEHNRLRARIRREFEWLPTRWYAVDLDRRLIHNVPYRGRWRLYAAHGVETTGDANGRGVLAACLGWPTLPLLEACVMAAIDRGAGAIPTIHAEIVRLRSARGIEPAVVAPRSIDSATSALRKRGFLKSRRRPGKSRRIYEITVGAVMEAREPCPVVAVRGERLDGPEFAGFERANDKLKNRPKRPRRLEAAS